jgi:hypothetical protein
MARVPDDAVMPILRAIQERLSGIETRLSGVESTLTEIRSEMDGQFELMMSRGHKADALERIVAAHARRITALERSSPRSPVE